MVREATMQPEQFFTTVSGPPLAANTAINKDIGVYHQNLTPYSVSHAFKKSSAPPHCLAVSDTHVFAAQENKAHVHVYSRAKGSQECFVAFPERIRCLALVGQVLVLGTVEGRLILWEVCAIHRALRSLLTGDTDIHWASGHHAGVPCTSSVMPRCHPIPYPVRI